MTEPTNVERILDAFLAPEADRLPDRVMDAALSDIARTPQRPAMRAPWRTHSMSFLPDRPIARVAAAAAIVAVLVGGSLYASNARPRTGAAGSPTPIASESPTPTPGVSAATSLTLGLQLGPGVHAAGTIVFGLHDNATDSDRLYALSPDGSSVHVLAEGGTCCPVLPPDGEAVMTGRSIGGLLTPVVLKMPVEGGYSANPWINFVPGVNLQPGAWSVNDDVAFQGWSDTDPAASGVYLSIENGGALLIGTEQRLTMAVGGNPDIPIAFSPDGTKLLFIRAKTRPGSSGDLYVVGIRGKGLRKLNPAGVEVGVDDAFGSGASWAPDGTRVAFAATDSGTTKGRAYVVDLDSGPAKVITGDSSGMTSARWSPDGSWIAYDGDEGNRDLWLVHPDGRGAHRITTTTGSCCGTWSPDSKMLVFEGTDASGAGLFIAMADGSGYSRLVTLAAADDAKWRAWGPRSPMTP